MSNETSGQSGKGGRNTKSINQQQQQQQQRKRHKQSKKSHSDSSHKDVMGVDGSTTTETKTGDLAVAPSSPSSILSFWFRSSLSSSSKTTSSTTANAKANLPPTTTTTPETKNSPTKSTKRHSSKNNHSTKANHRKLSKKEDGGKSWWTTPMGVVVSLVTVLWLSLLAVGLMTTSFKVFSPAQPQKQQEAVIEQDQNPSIDPAASPLKTPTEAAVPNGVPATTPSMASPKGGEPPSPDPRLELIPYQPPSSLFPLSSWEETAATTDESPPVQVWIYRPTTMTSAPPLQQPPPPPSLPPSLSPQAILSSASAAEPVSVTASRMHEEQVEDLPLYESPDAVGRMAKFINLSPHRVHLYWDRRRQAPERVQLPGGLHRLDPTAKTSLWVRSLDPFSAAAFFAFPDKVFFFWDEQLRRVVKYFITPHDDTQNLLVWDAIEKELQEGPPRKQVEFDLPWHETAYTWWKRTIDFDTFYHARTNRTYLSRYGRALPKHHMWQADYVGQQHTVTTSHIYWEEQQQQQSSSDATRDETTTTTLQLNLTVLATSPRVFDIPNFLSPTEVENLLALAEEKRAELQKSEIGTSEHHRGDSNVRSSRNTWIHPNESPVMQTLYRRVGDLLRIPQRYMPVLSEAELQKDPEAAFDPPPENRLNVVESLQFVSYTQGNEYKSHFDFGIPSVLDPKQPTRFATLLLYLNEDMEGGETEFLKATSTDYADDIGEEGVNQYKPLRITPQTGRAALFYNMLPDGNMDEKSAHSGLPVKKGEKLLANLWIWDPYMDLDNLL